MRGKSTPRPLIEAGIRAVVVAAALVSPAGAEERPRETSLCAVLHPSDASVSWECRRLNHGETLESLFRERWVDVARFNRLDRRHARPGTSIKVPSHLNEIAGFTPLPRFYPAAAHEDKFILLDLSEQFLGAYERGRLIRSTPATTGQSGWETPAGAYRVFAAHATHQSSLYTIEQTEVSYPMHWALLFYEDPQTGQYWIHGRDIPGHPVTHGCIGLYDEPMQREYYGTPTAPLLNDARWLYRWVLAGRADSEEPLELQDGPTLMIVGRAPALSPSGESPGRREEPGGCRQREDGR